MEDPFTRRSRQLLGAAVALLFCVAAFAGRGWAEDLFLEGFDDLDTPGLVLDLQGSAACSGTEPVASGENAACVDDISGESGGDGSGRLVLTHEFRNQIGYAWFEQPLSLGTDRITAALDLFVSSTTQRSPDGFSLVFLMDDGAVLPGRPGASLGTGGLPGHHVSVAVDLKDNDWSGGPQLDPESPCDDLTNRTCHVEINQDGDPAVDPSVATSVDVPDFLAAGAAGTPVHLTVTLNGREILVSLATAHDDYGSRTILHTLLETQPGSTARLALLATTGSGSATMSVDNLAVRRDPLLPPVIQWTTLPSPSGINCGGPELEVVLDGQPATILADAPYGAVLEAVEGTPSRFVLLGAGRVATGEATAASYEAPIANLQDASLEPLFLTEVSSPSDLLYRAHVPPGRYEVTLCWAENSPLVFDPDGGALRRFDVEVQQMPALRFFSPAQAAGADGGLCTPVPSSAVMRRFEADATPLDASQATIDVRVRDLGGGVCPGDSMLNAVLLRRTGPATAGPLSGDLENHRPPLLDQTTDFREVLNLDFAAGTPGGSAPPPLEGIATINAGRFFTPSLVDGRLRLADDRSFLSSTSVIFDHRSELEFDPVATRVRARFDAFISNPDGKVPAEGFVFAIVGTDAPEVVGGPGGDLGFGGIGIPGIGVEVDLWQGGGHGDDSGYNTDGQAHMAVVGSGCGPATIDHVQDQNDFDPQLDSESGGWIDWLSPLGVHVEILYTPGARVEAYAESIDGSFPRTKVLDTFVAPFENHLALAGLFASSGAETATIEIDNFVLEFADCTDAPEVARISGDRVVASSLPPDGAARYEFSGDDSSSGDSEDQRLTYRWSISGPFDGAHIEQPCAPRTSVLFFVPGVYKLTLTVDDQMCARGPEASDTVTVYVQEAAAGPRFTRADNNLDGQVDISDPVSTLNALFLGKGEIPCSDAADTNDDGGVDISDAVFTLVFLFMGGPSPPEPFPLCGPDPTLDALLCEAQPTCR